MLALALRALAPLTAQHWILDGFPRTVAQATMLDAALVRQGRGLNLVVNLGVDDDVILRRIEGASAARACRHPARCPSTDARAPPPTERFVHVPSGRVYSANYNPPQVAGLDDVTGDRLQKRPDDTPVRRRQAPRCPRLQHARSLTLDAHLPPSRRSSKSGSTCTTRRLSRCWPSASPVRLRASRARALG